MNNLKVRVSELVGAIQHLECHSRYEQGRIQKLGEGGGGDGIGSLPQDFDFL